MYRRRNPSYRNPSFSTIRSEGLFSSRIQISTPSNPPILSRNPKADLRRRHLSVHDRTHVQLAPQQSAIFHDKRHTVPFTRVPQQISDTHASIDRKGSLRMTGFPFAQPPAIIKQHSLKLS